MSPVCSMKAGFGRRASIRSSASRSVPVTSVLAALLKPIWLSLIWTKLRPPADGSAASAVPMSREPGTPPVIVQRAPVPTQAMQPRRPRRSMVLSCIPVSSILGLTIVPIAGRGRLFPAAPRGNKIARAPV